MANAGRSSQRATGREGVPGLEREGDSRAAPGAVRSGHRAAVRLGDRAHDRKAQAGPFVDGVPAAVERLEDGVQLGGVEAGAGVVDLDGDRLAVGGRGDVDDARLEACAGARSRSGCRAPAGPSCRRAPRSRPVPRPPGRRRQRRPSGRTRAGSPRPGPRATRASDASGSARAPPAPGRAGPRRRGRGGSPRRTRPRGRRGDRRGCAPSGERRVDLGLQDRERRPQLVARVVDEAALALERLLEPVEGEVQRHGQAARACRRSRAPGSRWVGSDAEMAAASRRMRSTGRSAAPARSHPMSDDRMRATGNAIANRTSAVWRASWLSLSVAPTTTKAGAPAFVTGRPSRRDESRPGGRSVDERRAS